MQVKAFVARRPRVEMVPLIDMFFLLLVFFIYAVFSMTLQQGILVDLPSAATATAERMESVTVSVTADGALYVDQEPVNEDQLAARLQDTKARMPEAVVIVNADRGARHGSVLAVLDASRHAGLQRVSIQAVPETP